MAVDTRSETHSEQSNQNSDGVSFRGYFFMLMLALQFGLQPIFTKENVSQDADKVPLVLLCEATKTIFAILALVAEGSVGKVLENWNFTDCISSGAVPAAIYSVQNVFIQIGYQHTSGLMFNLLNQTKIIFTAIMIYLVVGKRQSNMQLISLLMVLFVGVTLSLPPSDENTKNDKEFNLWNGVIPTLIAALLSGIAAGWSQRVMQGKAKRNAALFSAELSFFSTMFLLGKMFAAESFDTSNVMKRFNILIETNPSIWIHLGTNAVGGIFVGQVIKYAGGLRKSFSVIAGMILTGVAEWYIYNKELSPRMYYCLPIAVASMYIYATNPYTGKEKTE